MDRIIIADTSCLIALSNIDLLYILKDLYQEIIITKEVQSEYGENLPGWFIVSEVKNKKKQLEIEKRLDKGEASSIVLALETKKSILIIDEVLAVGDATFQKKCLGKMQDVAQGGRSVLFVSHNLSAVRRL